MYVSERERWTETDRQRVNKERDRATEIKRETLERKIESDKIFWKLKREKE